MVDCSVVTVTFASEEKARPLIDVLLENRMAACVQVLPVKSHYIWDGAVQRESETLLIIKCRTEDYKRIEDEILRLHEYETPEIVRIDIADGFEDYLFWINEVTQK